MSESIVTAADVMSSPVVAVTAEHSLAAAWETMRQRRVHHLAVIDHRGLAAVLDDRELAARWPAGGPEVPHSMRVEAVMKWGVRCALPDEPLWAVARMMVEGRCDAVPVVTGDGVVLGLVTATDLVGFLAREEPPTTPAECEDASHG